MSPSASNTDQPLYSLRQRVRLGAEPSRRGRVVDGPRQYGARFEYCVIFGDDEGWYAEADLEPVSMDGGPRWQTRAEFLRDLLLAKLRGQLTDNLYAYRASRTDFVPYQFRPALKFLRNPDQRILIADEVGLGKTIEAAIIYLELKARLNITRVLVLCPSRLKVKWQDELRNRFEEEFVELDSVRLRRFIDDTRRLGGKFPFKAIASYEMMRSPEFVEAWTENSIPLDLLIVDEAHYMRNQDTRTFQLGAALTDSADAVVFLTATPLHLGNRDLYNLLHLLSPGEFGAPELFESQVEPNAAIIRAGQYLAAGHPQQAEQALRQVERTVFRHRFLKNPYYHEVLDKLRAGVETDRERVLLQRELLELNTLSNLFTRTRKREVTRAAVRSAYTLCVELTPAERRFYDAVLADVQQELASRRGAQSFATIMKERQAASCLAAMREAVDEASRRSSRAALHIDHSAFDIFGPGDDDPQLRFKESLPALARSIGATDSKFDLFEHTLRDALAATPDSKVLVFSFFRRTLAYLKRRLDEQGYSVEVLNGDVPVPDRKRVIERFRNDPSIRVLLSSEVGAEGLDFQFCDILVNYDLPWNPMQVEQRIGRLDRFGQEHEKIRIYNFYIAETIETRIFQRLYDRIGIFERSIGDLEAILGEEIKHLSEAVLRPSLTPQEQEKLAEQAARRIARHQIEAEELEREKDQLLGQEAIFSQQIEETIKSGRVISPAEVQALVSSFLADRFPRVSFVGDHEEPCWSLRITPELSTYLEQFMLGAPQESRINSRFMEALHSAGTIPLTFDSEAARKRPLLEFVTTRHPLAAAAIHYWQQKALGGVPATRVQLEGVPGEVGQGYFFVYQLTVSGARPQITPHPLIILDDGRIASQTAETLLSQLQRCQEDLELKNSPDGFQAAQQQADRLIAHRRDALKEEALRRNEALVAAQKAAVDTSYEAKIRRAQEQSQHADDERIRRMRSGQVRNLAATKAAKLAALDEKAKVSVSYTLVAGGRVRIVPATAAVVVPPTRRRAIPAHASVGNRQLMPAPIPARSVRPAEPSRAPAAVSPEEQAQLPPPPVRVARENPSLPPAMPVVPDVPAQPPLVHTRGADLSPPSEQAEKQSETITSKALRFIGRLFGKS